MAYNAKVKLFLTRALTLIVTTQMLWTGSAKASSCNPYQLAQKSKLYNLQARDARENAQNFQEIYSEAYKDVTRSQMIMATSAFLLFAAELMIVAEGAAVAVPTHGIIAKLGYGHAQATEALAIRVGGMFSNEFLTVLPAFASHFIVNPHLLTLGASTIGGTQASPEDDISKKDEFMQMTEKLILSQIDDRRNRQAQLLEKAPNQFLDGLTLGALDKKWTYQMWENAQSTADLMESLAKVKARQLTDCLTQGSK